MSEDIDTKGATWSIVVIFAALTVPFLLALSDEKRDCYDSKQTCEKDWNSSDCTPHPDPACRYLGRSYRFYSGSGGGGGGGRSSSSIGSISRGGFGSIGHAFGGAHS